MSHAFARRVSPIRARVVSAGLLVPLLLGGCASLSPDSGFGPVSEVVRQRLDKQVLMQRDEDEVARAQEQVRALLARKPFGAEDAVQVALLSNRGLQASFAELGIADADRVQATSLRNPRLHSLRTTYGDAVSKVEQGISFDVLGLLTLGMRGEFEARRAGLVQARLATEVVSLAAQVRRAWVEAVAAAEMLRYVEQVRDAADAGAELARRMAATGNASRLVALREQATYAEATVMLARAQLASASARGQLARLMGVAPLQDAGQSFTLPERLPALPATPAPERATDAAALATRLDVQAAKRELDATANLLGLTRSTRFINALELGRARTKEDAHPFSYGYSIALEVPLFDWGQARTARAEAQYMQAVHRLADVALGAGADVRDAWRNYRHAWEGARHYRDEVVPLRKRISEETLLRYNGMLIGVNELLADSREQATSVTAAIGALRDFWVADAALQAAIDGAGARPAFAPSTMPTAAAAPATAAAGH